MCVLLTPSLLRKLRYWTILEEDEVETSDNTSTCIVLVSRSPLLMMGSCCFLSMRVFFSGIVYTAWYQRYYRWTKWQLSRLSSHISFIKALILVYLKSLIALFLLLSQDVHLLRTLSPNPHPLGSEIKLSSVNSLEGRERGGFSFCEETIIFGFFFLFK